MSKKDKIENEVQKELEELSPTLAKLPKSYDKSVPDGYFDSLADFAANMARKTKVQKDPVIRRIFTPRNIAVAASLITIAMLAWIYIIPKEVEELALMEVSVEEAVEYLEGEDMIYLDEDELIEELVEIEMELEEEIEEPVMEVEEEEIDADALIEYLMYDNIDLATIIDEF